MYTAVQCSAVHCQSHIVLKCFVGGNTYADADADADDDADDVYSYQHRYNVIHSLYRLRLAL